MYLQNWGKIKLKKNEKFNQHLERIFQIMEISYLDVLPVAKSNPWRNNLYSEKDDHSQRKTISLRNKSVANCMLPWILQRQSRNKNILYSPSVLHENIFFNLEIVLKKLNQTG